MFESREEVEKAMLDLKVFEVMDKINQEEDPPDQEEEYIELGPQVPIAFVGFPRFLCYINSSGCLK